MARPVCALHHEPVALIPAAMPLDNCTVTAVSNTSLVIALSPALCEFAWRLARGLELQFNPAAAYLTWHSGAPVPSLSYAPVPVGQGSHGLLPAIARLTSRAAVAVTEAYIDPFAGRIRIVFSAPVALTSVNAGSIAIVATSAGAKAASVVPLLDAGIVTPIDGTPTTGLELTMSGAAILSVAQALRSEDASLALQLGSGSLGPAAVLAASVFTLPVELEFDCWSFIFVFRSLHAGRSQQHSLRVSRAVDHDRRRIRPLHDALPDPGDGRCELVPRPLPPLIARFRTAASAAAAVLERRHLRLAIDGLLCADHRAAAGVGTGPVSARQMCRPHAADRIGL